MNIEQGTEEQGTGLFYFFRFFILLSSRNTFNKYTDQFITLCLLQIKAMFFKPVHFNNDF